MEVVAPVHICMDDKWRLSKKGSRREERVSTATLPRSVSVPSTLGRSNSCSSAVSAAATRRRKTERCSFTRRCASLVKEQRARFYIMRRCVTMLVCWREYRDC